MFWVRLGATGCDWVRLGATGCDRVRLSWTEPDSVGSHLVVFTTTETLYGWTVHIFQTRSDSILPLFRHELPEPVQRTRARAPHTRHITTQWWECNQKLWRW